jgi:hypothetical protein
VGSLLSDSATSYVVVTSAEPVALNEAGYLVGELRQRRHRLEAVLANRLVPAVLANGATARAEHLAASTEPLLASLASAEREIATVATRELQALERIREWGIDVLVSESRGGDITDIDALLALGEAVHRR